MSGHPLWTFAHALRKGLSNQQPAEIAPWFDEDVDWAIYGPIDMFPYLGARQGREAALDAITQIADNFRLQKVKQEEVLLGDQSASLLLRCSLSSNDDNRPISLRIATFLRFKDGKVASMRAVIDTFDLVEQALGRPIHLRTMA